MIFKVYCIYSTYDCYYADNFEFSNFDSALKFSLEMLSLGEYNSIDIYRIFSFGNTSIRLYSIKKFA